MIGVCKWFSDKKGWGFIVGENGEDFFVHWKNIVGSGHRSLWQGDRIATDVLLLQGPERER